MAARSYNTKQREAVLACLTASAGDHMTAQEVTDRLRESGGRVGLTTVYRCLDRLVGEGVLVKYSAADGGSACFRLADCGSDRCFHMKCEKCGAFLHVECERMHDAAAHIFAEHGFTVDPYKTVFYGRCDKCKDEDHSAR